MSGLQLEAREARCDLPLAGPSDCLSRSKSKEHGPEDGCDVGGKLGRERSQARKSCFSEICRSTSLRFAALEEDWRQYQVLY